MEWEVESEALPEIVANYVFVHSLLGSQVKPHPIEQHK